jgi:hypothetical protein
VAYNTLSLFAKRFSVHSHTGFRNVLDQESYALLRLLLYFVTLAKPVEVSANELCAVSTGYITGLRFWDLLTGICKRMTDEEFAEVRDGIAEIIHAHDRTIAKTSALNICRKCGTVFDEAQKEGGGAFSIPVN